jgi:hypothetical protein
MRFNRAAIPLMALLLMGSLSAANTTYLAVYGPVNITVYQNTSVYLGKVGPGESFYVLASAATNNATGSYVNLGWDTLTKVSLPSGWSAQSSPLYQNPMKMKITVAPDTPYGIYNMTLRAVNIQNYSRLGNLTFTAYVNVTPNVFQVAVTPRVVSTGPGQPVNLYVTINNTGISDDPFIINAQGLPAWNISDQVIALHATTSRFTYPVFVNTPGQYKFNLTTTSATSQLLTRQTQVTIDANANLFNDYSAIGQGVIISPVIMEPAYSFMLLLSYIYQLIFQ